MALHTEGEDNFKNKILKTFNKCSEKIPDDLCLILIEKLVFLRSIGRYHRLIKTFFSCNDKANLYSVLFEISFANDFEKMGIVLEYERGTMPNSKSTVDFLGKIHGEFVHFELVRAQQLDKLTDSINKQLVESGAYSVCLGGKDLRNQLIRLQRILLGKCQNKNGKQHKFPKLVSGTHNIIVVNVEEQLLGIFNSVDCLHLLYGDRIVNEEFRIGLSGLFEKGNELNSELENRFKMFRENISAVLFARREQHSSNIIIPRLEYLLVKNYLIHSSSWQEICHKLEKNLPPWKK